MARQERECSPRANFLGSALGLREYVLMSEAGMSFRQILASLTTDPAERFGDADKLGRIAAGFQADLAVFRQDPSANIRALAAVQYTLRAGKIIYRVSD
ncbi:MAG: amidohydrolase family protein [Candidatus Acidiferrum sp.]